MGAGGPDGGSDRGLGGPDGDGALMWYPSSPICSYLAPHPLSGTHPLVWHPIPLSGTPSSGQDWVT